MKPLALITGGQRGIGMGVARELAAAGFALALASDVEASTDEVQTALAELGSEAQYYQHDLRDVSGAARIVDHIEATQGPVSTLVSNAGVSSMRRGDMLEMTVESWDFVMDINLKGGFFLAQQVASRMINRAGGPYRSMIFITSVNAEMVSKERADYSISKAGAGMMAKLFADRLAPEGIGVYDLRPGIIETDMTAIVKDKYTARIEGGIVPAARWGYPSDIGSVVLPLAQGKMAFATGSVIPVDGGLSLNRL